MQGGSVKRKAKSEKRENSRAEVRKPFKPADFEAKWQKKWESDNVFSPNLDEAKNPYFNLMMFPYPSAEGMHVGNMYAHTGADIHGRFRRMQGNTVFEPIGLDGFGIHSENYAMKVGRHPKEQAELSEANFYRQMHATGAAFDWQRTVETYDPEYYKWTQWLFTQMFKAGLAYKDKASVNYCPSCKTVLSDEQVIAGECERCGSVVEKRELEQWFFRITQYAGRLVDNIPKLDWTPKVKIAQTNWIGRSKGALITFPIADFSLKNGAKPNFVLLHGFGGSPDGNFFPWVKEKLEQMGYAVQVPALPNSDNPTEDEQVSYVMDSVKIDENTILFGHSLGSVVAMKVAEKLDHSIAGLVLSGTFAQANFRDHARPFEKTFRWEFDNEKIKKTTANITVIHDMGDDAIPYEQANKVSEMLGVELQKTTANSPHFDAKIEPFVLKALIPHIDAFTTRPDTIFGATFMVIAPEHPIVKQVIDLELKIASDTLESVKNYVSQAANKTEQERIADDKVKTGVFSGLYAVNPASGEKIPVWIADYVLAGYGTGAIMAVPGHDQRDYDFATKYDLPIKHVVMPSYIDTMNPPQEGKENTKRTVIIAIVKNPQTDQYLILKWKTQDWKTFITGGVEDGEDLAEAAKREVAEETGYTDLKLVRELGGPTEAYFYAAHKGVNRQTKAHIFLFELQSEHRSEVADEERDQHEAVWMSGLEVEKAGLRHGEFGIIWDRVKTGKDAYVGDGLLQNSGDLNGYHSQKDSDKVLQFISEKGFGQTQEQYHLRDWLISRQRYWGPPIPMLYCEACAKAGKSWLDTDEAKSFASTKSQAPNTSRKIEESKKLEIGNWNLESSARMAGWYPVPDTELPVVLPDIQDFKPQGGGMSPLANHPEFYEVTCPECGGTARRETDVSDTFLDSAWYFFRYISTEQHDKAFSVERAKRWLPVNIYIGGAEHSVLHLLYARFVTMVLNDLGYIDFEEPFSKFYAHGLLIKEGAKMSKSKGNVIVPDEYIEKYGADTLRTYLMFLGPFDQGGDFYDSGIEGMFRFLRRVWILLTERVTIGDEDIAITRFRHKTIAGVTKDLEDFGYNTAISKLMELYNMITRGKEEFDEIILSRETVESFIKMLAPFAVHMSEELYQRLRTESQDFESVHLSRWPEFDAEQLEEDTVLIIVQVNGKKRAQISVASGQIRDRELVETHAREKVTKYLTSPEKKVIYVPGKIINFVV